MNREILKNIRHIGRKMADINSTTPNTECIWIEQFNQKAEIVILDIHTQSQGPTMCCLEKIPFGFKDIN